MLDFAKSFWYAIPTQASKLIILKAKLWIFPRRSCKLYFGIKLYEGSKLYREVGFNTNCRIL